MATAPSRAHPGTHTGSVPRDLAPPCLPPEAQAQSHQGGVGETGGEPLTGLARVLVVGGAGFVGCHFVDRFMADPSIETVTVYDNFSSGRRWHLARHAESPRLNIVEADVKDLERLVETMRGCQLVV